MSLQQINAATQINATTQVPVEAQTASMLISMLFGGN